MEQSSHNQLLVIISVMCVYVHRISIAITRSFFVVVDVVSRNLSLCISIAFLSHTQHTHVGITILVRVHSKHNYGWLYAQRKRCAIQQVVAGTTADAASAGLPSTIVCSGGGT